MNGENFQLVVAGINYKTSTISERETFQINRKEIPEALSYFHSKEEVEGIVIVSTCNRLEFYFLLKNNADPFPLIHNYYLEKKNIEANKKQELFYVHRNGEVAKHLFRVTTGLDSMILGEYQVQGQIKEAYSIACSQKTADKILHKLFHAAFRTGKSVRNETKIGSGKQSISGIACKVIKEKVHKEDVVTIIGVNQNTKIIADYLYKSGFSHLIFVNRTLYKAEELAEKYKGLAFSLDRIEDPLISSRCIFSCTAAAGFILSPDVINTVYRKSNSPKLIIDMAVPRDVNTNGLIKDIEVIDLEGLKTFLDKQEKEISLDLNKAEKIISVEANVFEAWNDSQKDEYLGYFAEKAEKLRLQLLEENRLQISDDELLLLDKFSRSLLHRLKSTINQTILINEINKKEDY